MKRVFFLLVTVAGCARNPNTSDGGRVTGTMAHQGRLVLPADAVVQVQLLDVSRQDTGARVVAQTTIMPMGRIAPLPFELRYLPRAIDQTHSYAVRATIRGAGFLLYITETHVPVITQGNPTHVKLMLVRAKAQSGAT